MRCTCHRFHKQAPPTPKLVRSSVLSRGEAISKHVGKKNQKKPTNYEAAGLLPPPTRPKFEPNDKGNRSRGEVMYCCSLQIRSGWLTGIQRVPLKRSRVLLTQEVIVTKDQYSPLLLAAVCWFNKLLSKVNNNNNNKQEAMLTLAFCFRILLLFH